MLQNYYISFTLYRNGVYMMQVTFHRIKAQKESEQRTSSLFSPFFCFPSQTATEGKHRKSRVPRRRTMNHRGRSESIATRIWREERQKRRKSRWVLPRGVARDWISSRRNIHDDRFVLGFIRFHAHGARRKVDPRKSTGPFFIFVGMDRVRAGLAWRMISLKKKEIKWN